MGSGNVMHKSYETIGVFRIPRRTRQEHSKPITDRRNSSHLHKFDILNLKSLTMVIAIDGS